MTFVGGVAPFRSGRGGLTCQYKPRRDRTTVFHLLRCFFFTFFLSIRHRRRRRRRVTYFPFIYILSFAGFSHIRRRRRRLTRRRPTGVACTGRRRARLIYWRKRDDPEPGLCSRSYAVSVAPVVVRGDKNKRVKLKHSNFGTHHISPCKRHSRSEPFRSTAHS